MTAYWKFVGAVLGLLILFVCAVTVGNLVSWSQTLTTRPPTKELSAEDNATRSEAAPRNQDGPAMQVSLRTEQRPPPARAQDKPDVPAVPLTSSKKPDTRVPETARPRPAQPTPAPAPVQRPEEPPVEPRKSGTVRLVGLRPAKGTPASRPASQPTSQPALAKYYNLLKNEFMIEEDTVRLLTPALVSAIKQLRAAAAAEKASIDQDIMDITREIAAANAAKKGATKAKRESDAEAAKHSRNADTLHLTPGGAHNHHDPVEADRAAASKQNARTHRSQANAAQSDTRALMAEKIELQKQSAALGAVASPYIRILPPKYLWGSLHPRMQEEMSKVGLTLDEFKVLLNALELEEGEFINSALLIEKEAKGTDEIVDMLRGFFEERMGGAEERKDLQ